MRCTLVVPFFAVLLCATPGCKPTTMGTEDDPSADLAPRAADLAPACGEATGNLLRNPSFEIGTGTARNTGSPKSSISEWDGCCNSEGQGETTIWTVTAESGAARCGQQAMQAKSTAARGDVLNQSLRISDGAGRNFQFAAWARIMGAQQDAYLLIDLFDLDGSRVIGESARLSVAAGWQEVRLSGTLPQGTGQGPYVQARIKSGGTLTAVIDDLSLLLK